MSRKLNVRAVGLFKNCNPLMEINGGDREQMSPPKCLRRVCRDWRRLCSTRLLERFNKR